MTDDVRWWVEAGLARPGLCYLSYPDEILVDAFGTKAARALRADVDCEKSLLSDENRTLPKHLCLSTARASVQHYARQHFPACDKVGKAWVRSWPLPVGRTSLSRFAKRRGAPLASLPPPMAPDSPLGHVSLWIERQVYTPVELDGRPVTYWPHRGTRVTLFGRAEFEYHEGQVYHTGFARAFSRIDHASTMGEADGQAVWNGDELASFDWMPADHASEWSTLAAAFREQRKLLLWYEAVALGLKNERRGRPAATSVELRAAQTVARQAVAAARLHRHAGTDVTTAELVRQLQLLGVDAAYSTVYGWLARGYIKLDQE